MQLMNDTNLDRIVIENDGKTIRLKFIDMKDGTSEGTLICSNVILVNYHNFMDEGLASYVGEVEINEYEGEIARKKLNSLGFRFRGANGCVSIPSSGKVCHVHLEGGEISIDVCCSHYDLIHK